MAKLLLLWKRDTHSPVELLIPFKACVRTFLGLHSSRANAFARKAKQSLPKLFPQLRCQRGVHGGITALVISPAPPKKTWLLGRKEACSNNCCFFNRPISSPQQLLFFALHPQAVSVFSTPSASQQHGPSLF